MAIMSITFKIGLDILSALWMIILEPYEYIY